MNSPAALSIIDANKARKRPSCRRRRRGARPRGQAPRRTRFDLLRRRLLARAIDGYRSRASQIDMARAVAAAMEASGRAMPEPAMFEAQRRPARKARAVGRAANERRTARGRGGHRDGDGRDRWRREHADRRSGDRHRQDLRVSGAGAAVGRQGDRLDRHQDLQDQLFQRDIPTVRDGARRAGVGGAAQGPRELPVPLLPAAHRRTNGRLPTRQDTSHLQEIIAFREDHAHRRQGRARRACRRTRRSGRWSRRRATTASARNARITRNAS